AIGLMEAIRFRDLLAFSDGGNYADTGIVGLLRPNGPFRSNNSFALIGAILFFFLRFLRGAMPSPIGFARTWLHRVGMGASLIMAMLPLFRSVLLTFMAAAALGVWRGSRVTRIRCATAILLAVAAAVAVRIALPQLFEE